MTQDTTPAPARPTKRSAVAALYAQGVIPTEIARQLNISLDSVYNTASKAREMGLLPPRAIRIKRTKFDAGMKLIRYRCRKVGGDRTVGSMAQITNALTPSAIKWLVRITPEGMSVAETITSIINDAFYEETL